MQSARRSVSEGSFAGLDDPIDATSRLIDFYYPCITYEPYTTYERASCIHSQTAQALRFSLCSSVVTSVAHFDRVE